MARGYCPDVVGFSLINCRRAVSRHISRFLPKAHDFIHERRRPLK
jgi:hypothetical protein